MAPERLSCEKEGGLEMKTIRLLDYKISYNNLPELLSIFNDIFIRKEYFFKDFKEGKEPLFIIDCGAHIGLATLYFKREYPESEIIAFEPNPETFKLLTRNVENNNLENVTLVQAALSGQDGERMLFLSRKDWHWEDSLIAPRRDGGRTISVPTKRLSPYVDKRVDLLKLDIEGAEAEVIRELANERKLARIRRVIIEFHPERGGAKRGLEEILKILRSNDFNLGFRKIGKIFHPKVSLEEIQKGANCPQILIYALRKE